MKLTLHLFMRKLASNKLANIRFFLFFFLFFLREEGGGRGRGRGVANRDVDRIAKDTGNLIITEW